MSERDRTRWEQRHCRPSGGPALASLSLVPHATAGELVLDVACGQGRHSAALLAAGYRVVAVDISRNALTRLRSELHAPAHSLLSVQADLDDWPFRKQSVDGLLQCDFLDRTLFASLCDTVKPGGWILIDTFRKAPGTSREGPANPDFLLEPGELAQRFAAWRILACSEYGESSPRSMVLAIKP